MDAKGKIIIKLSELEEGFFIQKNVLIVLKKNKTLIVCKIKRNLTSKELKLLECNLEAGLRKIENKIQKGGPIAVLNGMQKGSIYYDDLMIMRSEGKAITCSIIG